MDSNQFQERRASIVSATKALRYVFMLPEAIEEMINVDEQRPIHLCSDTKSNPCQAVFVADDNFYQFIRISAQLVRLYTSVLRLSDNDILSLRLAAQYDPLFDTADPSVEGVPINEELPDSAEQCVLALTMKSNQVIKDEIDQWKFERWAAAILGRKAVDLLALPRFLDCCASSFLKIWRNDSQSPRLIDLAKIHCASLAEDERTHSNPPIAVAETSMSPTNDNGKSMPTDDNCTSMPECTVKYLKSVISSNVGQRYFVLKTVPTDDVQRIMSVRALYPSSGVTSRGHPVGVKRAKKGRPRRK